MGQFEQALEKYAKYVIQQSRSNLARKGQNTSKRLYQSLSYRIKGTNVNFEGLQYGNYQDQGVRGAKSTYPESKNSPFRYRDKMPPSKVFDKWNVKKGIAPRDEEGKFISRKSLNYLIARSIYKKGIRATLFFTKPFERGLDLYGDEIVAGYLEDNLTI